MSTLNTKFKCTVASVCAIVMFSLPAQGQQASVEELFDQLKTAEPEQLERIEKRIINAWSQSGSAAMDLLLKRGRDALEVRKFDVAIDHFTALTDHAPAFAEGWHGLALAYFNTERLGLALDALERTLALNPQHFGAIRGLGAVMEQVGHPDLAHRAYTQLLDILPNDADVQEALKRLSPQITGTTL